MFFWFLTLSCYVTSVRSGDTGKLELSFLVPVDGLQHPVLNQPATVLLSVLLQDKAPKTVDSYLHAFGARKCWAEQCRVSVLPVEPVVFSLYLVKMIQENKSVPTINSALYGVSWVQKKVGHAQVTEHPFVTKVADAARRILARPPERKKPLTADQVMRIISRLEKGSLADVQVAAIFAMGFFGFLQWDDLSNLAVDDLLFADSHVALFLLQRKNDQFRQGSWVFIARSKAAPCPVAVLEKFLKMGSHSEGSRLFRRIQSTKRGQVLKEAPMSYSRAGELVKKELKNEGLDPTLYSLHSLRSGDASSAAALEIPDRLFQRQGDGEAPRQKQLYPGIIGLLAVSYEKDSCLRLKTVC